MPPPRTKPGLLRRIWRRLQAEIGRHFLIRIRTFQELYPHRSKQVLWQTELNLDTRDIADLNLHYQHDRFRNDTYRPPEIYTLELANPIYDTVYRVLLHPSRCLLGESVPRIIQQELWYDPDYWQWRTFYRRPEKISGSCAVYRFPYAETFGHLLLNDLPRLLLLDTPQYQQLDEIKILYKSPLTALEQYVLPRILPANARLVPLERTGLYEMERCIYLSSPGNTYAPYVPNPWRDRYLSKLLPARPRHRPGRRLFISRERYANTKSARHITNEAALLARLTPLGFERVTPETLSPPEQIELFYDAEAVVGTYGSALTLITFASRAKVMVLSPGTVSPYFYFIAKAQGHTIAHWSASNNTNIYTNYAVDIDIVVAAIVKLLERSLP